MKCSRTDLFELSNLFALHVPLCMIGDGLYSGGISELGVKLFTYLFIYITL